MAVENGLAVERNDHAADEVRRDELDGLGVLAHAVFLGTRNQCLDFAAADPQLNKDSHGLLRLIVSDLNRRNRQW